MNKLHLLLLGASLICGVSGVAAQSIKPGLWEISNKMSSSTGALNKEMAAMQKEMASMPPEQRKLMEEMMAKQGVSMNAGAGSVATTIKVCMSKEMVERDEVAGPQEGDCKHSRSPRSGNTMKFSFVCSKPASSGEGQVTFVSPEAYSVKMSINSAAGGKAEKMSVDAAGKFLSSDCGAIKPLVPAKK